MYLCSSAISYARYDPSKGHYWEFPDDKKTGQLPFSLSKMAAISPSPSLDKDKKRPRGEDEPREAQRKKVDVLLSELVKKFPPKAFIGKVQS